MTFCRDLLQGFRVFVRPPKGSALIWWGEAPDDPAREDARATHIANQDTTNRLHRLTLLVARDELAGELRNIKRERPWASPSNLPTSPD